MANRFQICAKPIISHQERTRAGSGEISQAVEKKKDGGHAGGWMYFHSK